MTANLLTCAKPATLTLTRPDDWHLHVRDGAVLTTVVPHTARQFARAIIMPNLKPPVTTVAQAQAYAARIRAAVPSGMDFTPLMTLYLTDKLDPAEIRRASATRMATGTTQVVAAKLYPAGATTNSDAGVTDIRHIYPVLEAMQREGLLLLVHGEVTSPDIDLFDREAVFIDEQLVPLRRDFPELRIVMEHITTREAAHYVRDAGPLTAATVTAHHLLFNRNAIFTGGIRPHYYCLPVLKRETHRLALVVALVVIPPTPRWRCMPRSSTRQLHWTSSKHLPASSAPTSTACRATPQVARSSAATGRRRPSFRLATPSSSH